MNSINKTSLTLFAFSKNDTTCSFEASSRGPSKRGLEETTNQRNQVEIVYFIATTSH